MSVLLIGKCERKLILFYILTYYAFLFSVTVVNLARSDREQQQENQWDKNTTKDNIAWLLHLYKDPMAHRHWSNLYGILSRAELDARKSTGPQAEAANPLSSLAERFNDYEMFQPQNVMVEYVSAGPNMPPVKRQPYQASSAEWSALANHCHDIEPTNLSRKNILHGEEWIKETWNDCRKYLHQTFTQYHRSGQHDADMDEWCSPKELDRWVRATTWKTPGANSVIRFPSAMVYSIAVLDLTDFEGIGR
jgi:hypothetical protein